MDDQDNSENQDQEYGGNNGYKEDQEYEGNHQEFGDDGYEEDQGYEEQNYKEKNGYNENYYDEEEQPIFKEIPRFDPTVKDHKKFEVEAKVQFKKKNDVEGSDKKDDKKSEKMYFVDQSFKEKLSGNSDFSLLSLFGPKEPKKIKPKDDLSYNVDSHKYVDLYDKHMDYHEPISEYNRRMESEKFSKEKKSQAVLWDRPLFFKTEDSRMSEGITFFNNVEKVDPEKFKAKRNEIKYMVKSKMQSVKSANNSHNSKLRAPKNKLYALKTKFNKKRKFFNKPKKR